MQIISLYCFITVAASYGFSTLSAFWFSSTVSVISLLIMESVNCFLIPSLVIRLVFLLPEPCCCYKKTPLYHKSKTSFTNKKCYAERYFKIECNFIVLQRVLLYMIKGCKSTPSPHHFCKTVFKINPISKKVLKAFVKLSANNTQRNTYLVKHYCNQNLSGLTPSATKQKMFFCAKSLLLGL